MKAIIFGRCGLKDVELPVDSGRLFAPVYRGRRHLGEILSSQFSQPKRSIRRPGRRYAMKSYESICIRIFILIPFNLGKRELSGEKGRNTYLTCSLCSQSPKINSYQ
jgi:hypothetical protein